MGDDLRRVLREGSQCAAAVIVLRGKGVAQQPVDALPRGRDLRAFVFMRRFATCIEDLSRGDPHAEALGLEPEPAQAADEFLLRHDAGAAAGQLTVDALVNIDVPPSPPQNDPPEQATHRTANNTSTTAR